MSNWIAPTGHYVKTLILKISQQQDNRIQVTYKAVNP